MELIRGEHNLRPRHRGCVATIGNFDGVHIGHQAVLNNLIRCAREQHLPATVIVFEPQPAEYFAGEAAPARLTRLREKVALLAALGIDRLLVLRFDAALAALSADEFVRRILIDGLAVQSLTIGDDFKFGKRRTGDFSVLQRYAQRHGFVLGRADSLLLAGERVSSTLIRAKLLAGEMRDVERMLGRRYCIGGRVVHGHKRGREIGFPTANLDLHRIKSPLAGIYAVSVRGLGATPVAGVAYLGTRPIIDDPRFVLEVHLFDFERDCYGEHIEVDFVAKVRDDMVFSSFEALSAQIARDCEAARVMIAAA
ncbi:MAG: bifunctional riboflavin kinase/FAD synthetase [Gammaproteobacteria bacterium]|nr:bifunctional riboflavin kinase/FAD synthetase [Gammaproteobacteria bacterium]MBI5615344.1 bifunctional riboflavin kinase/FAD synthetase [Gammaproteobacteria bacterium]